MDGYPSPGHNTHRMARGLTALATLLTLLVVVPAVLIGVGGNPLPRHLPNPGSIAHALVTVDRSGALVIGTAVYLAWLAWLAFALAVLFEVTGRVRNRPGRPVPGFRVLQRAAAGLLTSVTLLTGTAGMATAAYAAPPSAAAVATVPAATLVARQLPAVYRDAREWATASFLGRADTDDQGGHTWRRHSRQSGGAWPPWKGSTTPGNPPVTPAPGGPHAPVRPATAPTLRGPVAPKSPPATVHIGNPVPVPNAATPSRTADGSGTGAGPLLALGLGFGLLGAHLAVRRRRRQGTHTRTRGIDRGHQRAIASGAGSGSTGTGPAAEFNRLDLALRDLATLLGDRDGDDLPDILGSWLVDGAVHLMLTRPCPAPAPWVENGLLWTLPAHAPAHSYFAEVAAPLPALVTVGGRDDKRVFLDLERLGVVTIGGDPQGATGLLRHVGAELCHGIWTDGVTVGIAGFTRQDTQQLIALGGGRVHDAGSIPDALDNAARFVGQAHDRLADSGSLDVLSARVSARPGDAASLSPYALLLAGPDADDLHRLERFDTYLADRGRGQIAIATTTQARLGRWPIRVDADHQVTMDFLDARVPAVSLAGSELAALADAPDRTRPRPEDQDVPVGRHRARRAPAA
ncbi:MAG TPA: hypothetical protein VKB69_08870 [Micromonosporaceae bacterium]|nr:hypothetical protein [Micromonosporaceae bacterium]